MAETETFDPAEYQHFVTGAGVDEGVGFDPQEYGQYKQGMFKTALMASLRQLGSTAMGDTTQFNKPMTNPTQLFNAVGPSRLSASLSAPGQMAGQNVTNSLNELNQNLTGSPPSPGARLLSKAAGMADAAALDPQSYAGASEPVGEAATGALDAATEVGVDKLMAPLGEILSATKQRTIKAFFKDPLGVLGSMSGKESGEMLGALYKNLGVTEEETRLIAKAADRGTGGSQAVYDHVLGKIKDGDSPTIGELIAARRAASKLSTVRRGMEQYQTVKDLNTFNSMLNESIPSFTGLYSDLMDTLAEVSKGKTRDAFMHVFPQNANTSANALRGSLSLAGAAASASKGKLPLAAASILAASPFTTGVGTLAAKGAYSAARAGIENPLLRGGLTSFALQRGQQ